MNKSIAILFATLFLVASCHKDDEDPNTSANAIPKKLTQDLAALNKKIDALAGQAQVEELRKIVAKLPTEEGTTENIAAIKAQTDQLLAALQKEGGITEKALAAIQTQTDKVLVSMTAQANELAAIKAGTDELGQQGTIGQALATIQTETANLTAYGTTLVDIKTQTDKLPHLVAAQAAHNLAIAARKAAAAAAAGNDADEARFTVTRSLGGNDAWDILEAGLNAAAAALAQDNLIESGIAATAAAATHDGVRNNPCDIENAADQDAVAEAVRIAATSLQRAAAVLITL